MNKAKGRGLAGKRRFVGWSIAVVCLLGIVALFSVGANAPADPSLGSATSSTAAGGTASSAASTAANATTAATTTTGGIPGFGEMAFQILPAGGAPGSAAQFCALMAENEPQRQQGLMGRSDLAGFDGMVFRFDADTTGAFYMRDVPVGLSIAWFGADGHFVSATDMASCPDQDGCPTYAPAGPYRFAVEVLQGGLPRLGAAPGAVLTVGGTCKH